MSNSIDSNLIVASLAREAVKPLSGYLAPLQSFVTLHSGGVLPVGTSVIQVPRVTGTPTPQTDPTDWESGNCTVTNVEVQGTHISVSGHVASREMNSGTRIETLFPSVLEAFAQELFDTATALLTTANYGAAAVTTAPEAFNVADAGLLAGALRARNRSLVLDTACFTAIGPSLWREGGGWVLPGYDGVFEVGSLSAGANVIGFAATPQAISGVVAVPEAPRGARGEQLVQRQIPLPDLGVSVTAASWVDPRYRTAWFSIECICGFAVADAGACKLVVSA